MTHPILTPDELRHAVARLPRVDLAHLPTPLEEAPRFADRVGSSRIFIKRDDCTGLLFGGNKTRHNEFVLADAMQQGADVLVWGASTQSNNCRQTAAACAKLGLDCDLHLSRATGHDEVQGNLLLDYLVGAKVEITDLPIGPDLDDLMKRRADTLRAHGRKPYVWDRHHVTAVAAISYSLCLIEILGQLRRQRLEPSAIYVSSSGSTGAGLALGKLVLGLECPLRSICPIRWPWNVREYMAEIGNRAAGMLELPHRLTAKDIDATEDHLGPGYGQVSPAGKDALDLLARSEGILLDPVYTSKAMAGLIDDLRQQRLAAGSTVVFIHTGGTPAVFAYRDELLPTNSADRRA
jgi:1-aminocyclopropane-1-carboxylate deaminase/D-cysteine desulfhydrase-like pyridoxal-dependent ACC family enzyme